MQYIIFSIISLFFVIIDQISKIAVINSNLVDGITIEFIPGIINFCYTRNLGMAFGLEAGGPIVLGFISLGIITLICVFLVKYINFKKNFLYSLSLALIVGGAFGNMVDRFFRPKGVIDFLQFGFWKSFAIFNLADAFLCIGTFLIAVYILFIYKEPKKKSPNDKKIEPEKIVESDL